MFEGESPPRHPGSGKNVVLLAGAGAVEHSWEPVRRALRNSFPGLRTAENADFAVAHLVYQLRFACSRTQLGQDDALAAQLRRDLERVRHDIAAELQFAQSSGELRPAAGFDQVIERLVLAEHAGVTLVTTNWDDVVDRRLTELARWAGVERLSIHHLHGQLSEPGGLYLPTETRCEPYRGEVALGYLAAEHDAALRHLEQAQRIVVYGLSLSPLDVELANAVGEGCRRARLDDLYVIDHDFCAVAERLSITLGRSDLPPIRCFSPDDLARQWTFPDACDGSRGLECPGQVRGRAKRRRTGPVGV